MLTNDPAENLPAQATEIQPPELGSQNDNMDTIQQREEASEYENESAG
jgi:hypothetical protein